jgi:hypothetical protein
LRIDGIATVVEASEAVRSLYQHAKSSVVWRPVGYAVLIRVLVDGHRLARSEVRSLNAVNDLLNGERLPAGMLTV